MRICLIDDDVVLLDALALGLRDVGYEVSVAAGGAAGLDVLARGRFDAAVTDMNMPGTSGADLIVQAREQWPNLPIVAMSGEGEISERTILDRARALGADAGLIKPFRTRDLDQALQAALHARGGALAR